MPRIRSRRCVGRCGRFVRRSRFSCLECLDRLPAALRRPIQATAGKPDSVGKRRAWDNGREWFAQGRRQYARPF
ncbi:hypothetical protein P9990_17725 [Prescottella equi]|uniref:hypothetical protein n=1 Tax=Rhodococcus hoagii TaxID=43767 RepID=UPI0025763387|nr:hypothetical protein [Prescottella equi]WJJ10412.1 hypothetical protein P9990_17725 [Prescottella equi]